MAELGISTKVYVDQFDFSGDTNGVEIEVNSNVVDATTFGDTGAAFVSGPGEGSITQNGYFSGSGAGSWEKELQARLSAGTVIVGVALGTHTDPCPLFVVAGSGAAGMKISAPATNVITVNGTWARGKGMKRGLRVHDGTVSATGAQTTRDFGAAGTTGGKAWLWVRGITGAATNAQIKVQSATQANFSDSADEGTFTFSGVGAWELDLSGAIGRYVRINVVSLGGATNITLASGVAVNGVTM